MDSHCDAPSHKAEVHRERAQLLERRDAEHYENTTRTSPCQMKSSMATRDGIEFIEWFVSTVRDRLIFGSKCML